MDCSISWYLAKDKYSQSVHIWLREPNGVNHQSWDGEKTKWNLSTKRYFNFPDEIREKILDTKTDYQLNGDCFAYLSPAYQAQTNRMG